MIYIGEAAENSPQIQHKPPQVTRNYVIINTTSEDDAYNAFKKWVPLTIVLDGCTLRITSQSVQRKEKAKNVWEGSCTWGLRIFPASFNTGGQTAHITQSLGTRGIWRGSYIGADGKSVNYTAADVPNFGGAIGYNGDSFEGVDVTIPTFTWTETHIFPMTSLTWAYVRTLAGLTGTVNANAFRGFAVGEVLFQGASGGTQDNSTEAPVQFNFAASPNVTNLTCGNITGIKKNGWDYLWVLYRDVMSGGYRFKAPAGVYVEQVYRYANFSPLGIGVT